MVVLCIIKLNYWMKIETYESDNSGVSLGRKTKYDLDKAQSMV